MKRQALLLVVAVQFLTRLPMPNLEGFQTSWLSESARYFPLVGALVGVIGVGVWWLSSMVFPPAVAIGLMMSASLLLTGAFHEDGFADVCDGFGGGRTRESVLVIMKDSRVGAYGAIGVAMMLGLKWSVLASLPYTTFPMIVVAAHTGSRWCAIGLIWRLRYIRTDAEAKSKPLANSLGGGNWLLSGLLGMLVLLPGFLLIDPPLRNQLALVLVASLVASLTSAIFAGAYFRSRIGGYTGDCLGAAQQLAELSFFLTALGILSWTHSTL
jgi:adenosylcobinamide-GDP ribazoletransferase